MKRTKSYRSAKSGKFTTPKDAAKHPDTTVGETRSRPREKKRRRR